MKKQEQEPRPHEVRDPELPVVQGVQQAQSAGGRAIS
mgnify:CR=1 FL=1